ncbi:MULTISPECIES: MmgE/PrpD family protein [unclassified Polaromonas]|uniref:MmgE/PrpD family protein n=1 Tax=unclassified Polaromonas TaxID=2638319 RepID=UPI0018CB9B1A|nr:MULTISPECIES: MmgE/PrpD family protein [unclassified Polaromonas]MBG6072985.1 2-methylcitrate dehydratase PrpD [Polaromonas sp. CG_9.7]MBG6114990.1 2-methylcitrate dehydratase PrpD [Polaromonas sp. CG_9.2]MDH6186087.1 2-methylcitrate dehydratase PrpD [Polaromonas sp. CG_23.6]
MARNTQVAADHHAPPVTQILAEFVANHPGFLSGGWSDAVDHEAHRTFMNWLGCAVGAARHEAADAAVAAVMFLQPAPQATLPGRAEKVDIASAALVNGITSHTFDFDDTHLKTIIHPAGPVASALLALGEHTGASGRELLDALVLGIDVACRVGNAMYPDHYDRGWHITGSTGTLGAAAACARLLKLDAGRTAMALGIAASQPIGMREQFGTMTKPFHPGAAARAGLMSALLAAQGYTASPRALEAPRGMMQTVSTKNDWLEITDELGKRFEISFNSYKPFACGIVIHPSIDACVQLGRRGVTPDQVESIELKVHSLVLELTGKKEPADGLQAKFSVYHGCAAGLTFGRAAEDEFSDAVVNRADMVALRRKVVATVDDSIDEASADVTAVLKDGQRVHVFVEHAIGSLQNPMTDANLEAKFHGLSDPVLGAAASRELISACWNLAAADGVRALAALAVPQA